MDSPVRIRELRFNGGSAVDVSEADVVVLVGPNNSGKSRTLQEIQTRLSWAPGSPPVDAQCFALEGVSVEKYEDVGQVQEWLRANRLCYVPQGGDGLERARTIGAGEVLMRDVPHYWGTPETLGQLAPQLLRTMFAGERLGYLGAPGRLEVGAPPDHPIQALIGDSAVRKDFERAFKQAFNLNLVVDAWGNAVRVRLSQTETQADFEYLTSDGFPSPELIEKLSGLSLLDTQSDGVRSFAGILLTLLVGAYPLVLLDEPEAFLHPPQARLLGRQLPQSHSKSQLFVATHSLDILLGLLESGAERVLLVRLTRDGQKTSSRILEPEAIAELWRDPLLRFSRTLDGLFHEAVIVGEGDTDTAFYNAVIDESGDSSLTDGRHVMFTYPGGKQRIPLVARALRAIGVPVRVAVDFDALNDAGLLQALIESMGGEWSEDIAKAHRVLDSGLRGSDAKLTHNAVRHAVMAIVGDEGDVELTRSSADSIRSALQPETGWRGAKKSGRAVVPHGEATTALDLLIQELRQVGIFVVPTGAVESFVPTVGGKSARWLGAVIEQGLLPTAIAGRNFVEEILHSLATS